MSHPNRVAEAVLIRDFQDGVETFRVVVCVEPGTVSPLKAVTALKSGCLMAVERVLKGETLNEASLIFRIAGNR